MTDRKFVLAINLAQYRMFIHRNGLNSKEYKYVDCLSDLMGVHKLILLGNYTEGSLYNQMHDYINFMCDCEYVGLYEDYPKTRVEIIYA